MIAGSSVPGRPPRILAENAPVDQDWAPGFMADLMLKDLGLALSLAHGVGATSPLGALTEQLYAATSKAGHGKKEHVRRRLRRAGAQRRGARGHVTGEPGSGRGRRLPGRPRGLTMGGPRWMLSPRQVSDRGEVDPS